MEGILAGLLGSIVTGTIFAFLAFLGWLDYRKKKEEREAAHQERLKALDRGFPPLDAEIQRAKAYAWAAWAAGVIGLVVPIVVVSLTGAATIVAVIFLHEQNITVPLIVGWSIAAVIMLVAIVRSLNVIRSLPRPTADTPPRPSAPEKRDGTSSAAFQEKRLEL
jgi:hypothetical protein